jgi:rod shape-determining protein MreC
MKRLRIIGCAAAFLFGFLIHAYMSGETATLPERVFRAASKPFVWVGGKLSGWANETADTIASSARYKRENEQLRAQLADMYSDVLEKERLEAENDDLKSLLGLSKTFVEYKWAPPCSIIGRNANDIYGGFTIDRGTNDGIKTGDAVFDEIGLIGRVSKVGNDFAEVITVLSPDLKISVRAATKSSTDNLGKLETAEIADDDIIYGIIENDAEHALKGELVLSCPNRSAPLKEGDKLITAQSSLYPAGILVGTVKSVYNDTTGLYLLATVKPETDVFTVDRAFVIIGQL